VALICDAYFGVAAVTQLKRIIIEFSRGILFRGRLVYMAFLTIFTRPVRVYICFGAAVMRKTGENKTSAHDI
jgi:hypothetical protein